MHAPAAADETLRAIAAYAKVATFPWAELEAEGKGLLQSDAYIDVLEQRFNQYFQVVWRLDIPELNFGGVKADDARAAVEDLEAAVVARSGAVFDALVKGRPLLALSDAVEVPLEVVRMSLIVLNAITWATFSGHDTGAWRWVVKSGHASLEEAKDSAASCYRLWTIVIDLDQAGILEPLKKPQFKKGHAGLGAEPLSTAAIIGLVVIAVAVVAAIAWLIITLKVESNRQRLIEQSCFDASGKLLSPVPDHCKKYLDAIAQDPNAHLAVLFRPLTEALSSAVKGFFGVLGAGVLLYVGAVYVLPAVLGAIGKRKAPSPAEGG